MDECRLRGGLLIEPLRLFAVPKSSRKSAIASFNTFLDSLSARSGSKCRDICLGSRSGFPSIISPSASIGKAKTTFSSLLDSSSGYAKMFIVIQCANPRGVKAGEFGASIGRVGTRKYWAPMSLYSCEICSFDCARKMAAYGQQGAIDYSICTYKEGGAAPYPEDSFHNK